MQRRTSKGGGKGGVTFGTVTVRAYSITMGLNPSTSIGPPVTLDWDYDEHRPTTIEEYERTTRVGQCILKQQQQQQQHQHQQQQQRTTNKINHNTNTNTHTHTTINRTPQSYYMSYYQRKALLLRIGFTEHAINVRERQVTRDRWHRKVSRYQSFPILYVKRWKSTWARHHTKRFVQKYQRQHTKQVTDGSGNTS